MNLPRVRSTESPASDLRVETRTHLFMVAMLGAGTALMPVRIRNLSASGALLEGSGVPGAGAAVTIRRGGLSVEGVVAWRSKTQAGIAFRSDILVSAWLPKNGSKQSAIDQYLFETKNGAPGSGKEPRPGISAADSDRALFELTSLRNELAILEDVLVQDIRVVAAHPEIQFLDIALQRIDRLLSLAEVYGMARKDPTA